MKIENAKYMTEKQMDADGNTKDVVTYIACTVDGVPNVSVPIDEANRHYIEIMKQAEEKTLTIADAD